MKTPLLPYDRARAHLAQTGWRGIAGWNRDAQGMSKKQIQESTLDLYAKGAKTLILGASRDGGFEIYYPTKQMKTEHVLTEIDRYGESESVVAITTPEQFKTALLEKLPPGTPDPRD